MKYGFIGVGNMGGAIVSCALKSTDATNVYLCELAKDKIQHFFDAGCNDADFATAASCDFCFIGVKPDGLKSVLSSNKKTIEDNQTVIVSMCASKEISEMESVVTTPIIRIMPNMPVASGNGAIMYTTNGLVTQQQKADFLDLMKNAGNLIELEEKYFEVGSSVSGCSPAFIAMFIEALADGGVMCGLPRNVAYQLAQSAVAGTANHLQVTGMHPGALKDAVCSPGGTTIVGVHALEKGGFRNAVINSILDSYNKSCGNK